MKSKAPYIFLISASLAFAACNSKTEPATAPAQPQEAPQNAAPAETAPAANDADEANPEAPQNEAQPNSAPVAPEANDADEAKTEAPQNEVQPDSAPETAPIANENNPLLPTADNAQAPSAGVTCEEAEGCECGETKCPMNAVCTDGVCKCGDTIVESTYTGYSCWEIAKGRYDLGCTEAAGCPCGKITVYANMGCSGKWGTCAGSPVTGRGLSCRHKPYKDMYYSLGCFKDECDCYGTTIHKDEICPPLECTAGFAPTPQGCTCDGRPFDENYVCVPTKENKTVNYCINAEGCACGETTCPRGSVCRRDKCVDRTTLKEIPEGFELFKGFPKCTAEECVCHKAKCKNGKYCLNGICYGDPYFRKIDGKVYYYHILTGDDLADAGEKEKFRDTLWTLLFMNETDLICRLFPDIRVKGSDSNLCQDPAHSNMTIADALTHCGVADIPENVASLYCTLDIIDNALVFSGWQEN